MADVVARLGDRLEGEAGRLAETRVDEPMFRRENVVEIARQSLFLHEVAHPTIHFSIDAPEPAPSMVCDRRQIGQALTNIVKNACEAVEARLGEGEGGSIAMTVHLADGHLRLSESRKDVGGTAGWGSAVRQRRRPEVLGVDGKVVGAEFV